MEVQDITANDAVAARPLAHRLAETLKHFSHLGFTAFGGPGVHVVILRQRFVDQLGWIDSTTFADLFSLGNALPGPGSTQLAFSIATVRNGAIAGLLAFFIWSLPASCGMAGLAAGIKEIPETLPPIVLAFLTGLNTAAVGLIALAAYQLSSTATTERVTTLIVFLSAAFGICYHAPWMYPSIMVGGGMLTLAWDFRRAVLDKLLSSQAKRRMSKRREGAAQREAVAVAQTEAGIPMQVLPQRPESEHAQGAERSRSNSPEPKKETVRTDRELGVLDTGAASLRQRTAASQLAGSSTSALRQPSETSEQRAQDELSATQPAMMPLMVLSPALSAFVFASFVILLIVALAVRGALQNHGVEVPRALDLFDNMLVAGTIICGGGPVVIPLLRGYVVDPGWVSSRDFLLGFAILQAFPGPNFAFACYLGVLSLPSNPPLGAVLGFLGIFTPGIMLKLSLLPLYNRWRRNTVAKSVLRGLNAAASGLVYTAVWQLFLVGYIYTPPHAAPGQVNQSVSGPLTADPWWAVVAAGSFVATQSFGVLPALSVLLGGVAGLAWFGVISK
ncbi:hypothetical protein K437DRAFT_271448 [Tilletiaria anomala UBC 951]|uniref:Chromate ion transporter n=1 Tax=Tilletiaria anomala (strain ATCC 24038 / CBS 436.72 / UBC 951) TaxID=1037660 RepID=A0A066WI57_TILAU|nr:uncharacterized protein K437DRAFT_271448 [Tilletiaria anomala UBC 951]KDN53516.1 hypothetical protein K437DRAFT_271448 [Tilletiaria anomala UBC 951]